MADTDGILNTLLCKDLNQKKGFHPSFDLVSDVIYKAAIRSNFASPPEAQN
jgi:hypothetical protein